VQLDIRNFHAAVEWSLRRGRVNDVFAIASGIFPFWASFGYNEQARRWLEQALASPAGSLSGRAHGLLALGDLALEEGERDVAKRANEASIQIFRALDEPLGVAVNLTQLADIALLEGDLASARQLAEESVAIRRERLASFHLGRALATLADISVAEGDYGRARELLEEAIEYWSFHGPESNHQMNCYEALGEVLRLQRDDRRALEAFATSLRIAQARGEPSPEALDGVAVVWATLGEREAAARIAGAAERLREELHCRHLHPDRPAPDRIEPAWSEGRVMHHDAAAEYVLGQLSALDSSGGGGN
jgi:tetratricopeptide (TPR) repeat protein